MALSIRIDEDHIDPTSKMVRWFNHPSEIFTFYGKFEDIKEGDTIMASPCGGYKKDRVAVKINRINHAHRGTNEWAGYDDVFCSSDKGWDTIIFIRPEAEA